MAAQYFMTALIRATVTTNIKQKRDASALKWFRAFLYGFIVEADNLGFQFLVRGGKWGRWFLDLALVSICPIQSCVWP